MPVRALDLQTEMEAWQCQPSNFQLLCQLCNYYWAAPVPVPPPIPCCHKASLYRVPKIFSNLLWILCRIAFLLRVIPVHVQLCWSGPSWILLGTELMSTLMICITDSKIHPRIPMQTCGPQRWSWPPPTLSLLLWRIDSCKIFRICFTV